MKKHGFVRIIGGKWRGRLVKVPLVSSLRPTPDRVRETLFNWLSPYIEGSKCIDLFAGSGVLGFEALSRGADYVEMIDISREVVQLLQQEIKKFETDETFAHIYQARVPEGLSGGNLRFDIVFLDPPYQENLLQPCIAYLEKHHFLADTAYIYLEGRALITHNDLPKNWQLLKSKKAGQVFYHLAKREKKV